jgi:hypothetical protein
VTVAGGLVLAICSALALNWGYVTQHGAARDLPPLSLRAPIRSLRSLFADLRWLAGFLVGIAGWVLYVAALALAPLSLVQAASAGGVGFIAVLAHRRGETVTHVHRVAVAASIVGLGLLAGSLAGGTGAASHAGATMVAVWLAASVVAAGAALVAGPRLAGGAALGLAAGVLYAAGDVATKGATFGGLWFLLVPVLLACHGSAFVALQLGFQRGGALATAGTATLLTNALPILAGIVVFGERLPGGALGGLRAAAFLCVVAGAALLARGESGPLEERDSMRGEPLAAAGEAEPVGRRRAHVDLGAVERLG